MPLFSTPTQFAVLALMLVAGWFLGLASHPGGRKWRERYAAERDAHAAARKDADARVSAATARNADLERENSRLASVTPAAPVAVAPPRAVASARPAYPAGTRRGWFDWTNTAV